LQTFLIESRNFEETSEFEIEKTENDQTDECSIMSGKTFLIIINLNIIQCPMIFRKYQKNVRTTFKFTYKI